MNPAHLSDDELIALLYGLGDSHGHLAGCPACGERWDAMHRALGMARAESAKNADIGGRRLAAQRLEVLARVEQPSYVAWRWVPVAAAASYSVNQNAVLSVLAGSGLLVGDTTDTSFTTSVVTGPAHGTLTLNNDGSFSYVPAAGYVTDTFTYAANDRQR